MSEVISRISNIEPASFVKAVVTIDCPNRDGLSLRKEIVNSVIADAVTEEGSDTVAVQIGRQDSSSYELVEIFGGEELVLGAGNDFQEAVDPSTLQIVPGQNGFWREVWEVGKIIPMD